MLKKTKLLLGFTAVLTALLIVVSCFIQPERITDASWIDNRDRNALSVMNEPENSIDVLVLGDSESFTAISPYRLWQKQKITAYVCGQSGQQISEAYYLMKRAFQKQHPRLVILETNELFTHARYLEETRMAVTETGKYYMPVFSYHNRWKDFFFAPESAEIRPDEISWKGFEIRKACRPCEKTDCMAEEEPRELFSSIKYYLKKIKKFCDEQECDLLLLGVPSPKNWNAAKHRAVAGYAKAEGIDFQDLNLKVKELKIDWQTDSYDGGDHLNLQGAEKVTDHLGNYLKENYDFSDSSSAAGKKTEAFWDAGLKEYLECIQNGGKACAEQEPAEI